MKLIVGLGNPEKKYENTFHNLGFTAVKKAADKVGAEFKKEKCKAVIAEYKTGKDKVIFAKPLTYMNLSGECVAAVLNYYKEKPENALIVYDDLGTRITDQRPNVRVIGEQETPTKKTKK